MTKLNEIESRVLTATQRATRAGAALEAWQLAERLGVSRGVVMRARGVLVKQSLLEDAAYGNVMLFKARPNLHEARGHKQ